MQRALGEGRRGKHPQGRLRSRVCVPLTKCLRAGQAHESENSMDGMKLRTDYNMRGQGPRSNFNSRCAASRAHCVRGPPLLFFVAAVGAVLSCPYAVPGQAAADEQLVQRSRSVSEHTQTHN